MRFAPGLALMVIMMMIVDDHDKCDDNDDDDDHDDHDHAKKPARKCEICSRTCSHGGWKLGHGRHCNHHWSLLS